MTYAQLLSRLGEYSDGEYRRFHGRLLKNDSVKLLGVRVPVLRRLAKELRGSFNEIASFPDEWYEVTFLKCLVAGELPYEQYVTAAQTLVYKLDNWATCDCFRARCVKRHRDEFLPVLREWLNSGKQFVVRYALVTLLFDYMDAAYLPEIFAALAVPQEQYYVMMGAAWLMAEVLVHFYERGVQYLKTGVLPRATHNKAIQKARESFRLSAAQKEELNGLKR